MKQIEPEEPESKSSGPPAWFLKIGFAGVLFLLFGDVLHQLDPAITDLLIALLISPMAGWEVYGMHRTGRTQLENRMILTREKLPVLFYLLMALFSVLALSPLIIALQWPG